VLSSRTNAFLKNTRDEKALTYNDISIQESYHVSQVQSAPLSYAVCSE
jgi:hypothetical protein